MCYICHDEDEPGNRLVEPFECGLPVHAACLKIWMKVSTDLAGEVIIYS